MKAKDLAKKLGVSPATISLVLNNKPGISDSLRKSLLEQIEQLGCGQMLCEACRDGAAPGQQPPPPSAGNGCSYKSIAYLIYQDREYMEDMNDPYNFFAEVLEGIESEAWDNDCCLIMVHMNKHKKVSVKEQLRRAGNVVGAIIHPGCINEHVLQHLLSLGIPCVSMDLYSRSVLQPPSVCVSNLQGMRAAVDHLKSFGHTDIGYVSSGWETPLNQERRRCFKRALEDFGLAARSEHFFTAGVGDGLFEFDRLADTLAKARSLPTALVCENDRQAWRTIKALQKNGLRVPEDVSVLGFDDQQICMDIAPQITTIHNSPQLMGRQCVQMLENLLRLKELGEEPWLRYELPARLVVRGSTGPAKVIL